MIWSDVSLEIQLNFLIDIIKCGSNTKIKLSMVIIIKITTDMLDMKVLIMLGDTHPIQITIIIIICQEMEQVIMAMDMVAMDTVTIIHHPRKMIGTVQWTIKKKKATIQAEMKLEKIPDSSEDIHIKAIMVMVMVAMVMEAMVVKVEKKRVKKRVKKKKAKERAKEMPKQKKVKHLLKNPKKRLKKKPKLKEDFHLNLTHPKLQLKNLHQVNKKKKVKPILMAMMLEIKMLKIMVKMM